MFPKCVRQNRRNVPKKRERLLHGHMTSTVLVVSSFLEAFISLRTGLLGVASLLSGVLAPLRSPAVFD